MEINTEDQFTNDIAPQKRSNLLTATCILTWICCAFMFLSTVAGIFTNTPEKQAEQVEQMRKFSPEAADKMEAAFANQGSASQIVNMGLSLVALGLSSLGAYMMWQLKKKGFFIYLAGEILPYIGMLLVGQEGMAALTSINAPGVSGSTIAMIMIVLMLVFDAVFAIMYAVNLKYMKNN